MNIDNDLKLFKVTISRTEITHYDVYVGAYGKDDASDRAYTIFNDCDLDHLEHHCLESSEHIVSVEDIT